MRELEKVRARTRTFGIAPAPYGRLRALVHASFAVLSLLGWCWVVLAGSALWHWAEAADQVLGTQRTAAVRTPEALPPPDAPPPPVAPPAASTPAVSTPAASTPVASPPDVPAPSSSEPAGDSARAGEGAAVPLPPEAEQLEAAASSRPEYHGAACSGVFVYGVTLSALGPSHSAVSLATSSAARSTFARPGERVGPWEVLGITDDWSGANPSVWLIQDGEVCRAGLTGNPERVRAARERERKKSKQRARKKRRPRRKKRR